MPTATTFVDTLQEIRRGKILAEMSDTLATLVTAVRTTGLSGTLTLTLKVAPASKGDSQGLMIYDDVRVKLPTPTRPATFMFANEEGILTRQDPRQPQLQGLRQPATVTPLKRDSEGEVENGTE